MSFYRLNLVISSQPPFAQTLPTSRPLPSLPARQQKVTWLPPARSATLEGLLRARATRVRPPSGTVPTGMCAARLDVNAKQAGVGPDRGDGRTPYERPADSRPRESDDRLERGGLPSPVRAEEPRYPSGPDSERQTIDCRSTAITLGQPFDPDGCRIPNQCSRRSHARSFRCGDLPVIRPRSNPELPPGQETTAALCLPPALSSRCFEGDAVISRPVGARIRRLVAAARGL